MPAPSRSDEILFGAKKLSTSPFSQAFVFAEIMITKISQQIFAPALVIALAAMNVCQIEIWQPECRSIPEINIRLNEPEPTELPGVFVQIIGLLTTNIRSFIGSTPSGSTQLDSCRTRSRLISCGTSFARVMTPCSRVSSGTPL